MSYPRIRTVIDEVKRVTYRYIRQSHPANVVEKWQVGEKGCSFIEYLKFPYVSQAKKLMGQR